MAMTEHTRNPVWGKILRGKVAESGLSQRIFADRHGFVPRTFNSWCNGRWPGEKVARDVAKALGVDYADLISERPGGIDSEIMKTVILIVDKLAKEMNLSASADIRATLYTLAYQYMMAHQSRHDLARYVSDLLTLSSGPH